MFFDDRIPSFNLSVATPMAITTGYHRDLDLLRQRDRLPVRYVNIGFGAGVGSAGGFRCAHYYYRTDLGDR